MSRLYHLLLRLLPARLRERHGAEMKRLFEERVAAARGHRRRRGMVIAAACWDVLRRAAYERVRRPAAASPGLVSSLGSDMGFALRTFARRPGLTRVAVLMLSLGVASSATVFTVVESLFLRPLPFPDGERLVYIDETAPRWNLELVGVNFADFAVWRDGQRAFEAIGLINTGSYNLSSGDAVERVDGARVTHDLLDVLGVTPVAGRGFTAEEDRPGAAPVVMLGHDLWRRQFGGSRSIIGETVRLDSEPHVVVGVLPPEASFLRGEQLWTPLRGDPTDRGSYSHGGLGRLKAGVTVAAAERDLHRAHQPIWEEHDEERVVSPIVMPLRERLVGDLAGVALALGVAVTLVLLIACGNVASILVARSIARRREMALRVALGAGSGRIARQLFGESLALALVAGPLGLVLGFWVVRLLQGSLPEGLPPWILLEPSWRTALFGLALVLVTAVLFGWAPVLQARKTDVSGTLADGGARAGGSRAQRRTMNALIVAEVTLAALLLVGSGLLLRSFQRLQGVDPGYRTENVLRFRIALPEATYPDSAAQASFYDRLLADLAGLTAVRAVGGIDCPPLGCHTGGFFAAENGLGTSPDDANPVVLYRRATPGYYEAMGIRAVKGRLLGPDDERPDRRTVVINETFARTFFGDEDPLGRRVAQRGMDFEEDGWRVVGVARNVMHYGVDEEMRPALYFPHSPAPRRSLAIALWTDVAPGSLTDAVRGVVSRADPDLPLYQVETVAAAVRQSLGIRRASSWAMILFAGLALVLALGGIYGVLSYTVGQRSREMGIRMALGSSRGAVLRLVLRHGLRLAGLGLALGFAAALATSRILEGLLVGFSALDPVTYLSVAALLLGASLLAALIPARRAVAVEVSAALRDE